MVFMSEEHTLSILVINLNETREIKKKKIIQYSPSTIFAFEDERWIFPVIQMPTSASDFF